MRVLATSFMMRSLALMGAMPEVAGQAISLKTYVQMPDVSRPPKNDRDAYLQKIENEMQAWQQKLHDFGDRAAAKGQNAGPAAEDELHAAWTNTEVEARRLQTAGTAAWDSAKLSYENASHGLAAAWDRNQSTEK